MGGLQSEDQNCLPDQTEVRVSRTDENIRSVINQSHFTGKSIKQICVTSCSLTRHGDVFATG